MSHRQRCIDISELTECLKEIYNSSDFDPEMNIFWDLQKADFSCISTEDVQSFMNYVSRQWGTGGKSKAALIVSSDLGYGMSRMYQSLMDGSNSNEIAILKDIKDINEANKWIEAGT
jgi:hypothetical protein